MSKRITKKQRQTNILTHEEYVTQNRLSLKRLSPITETQAELFDLYGEDISLGAIGTAGTGKTMCALYLALNDVINEKVYDKIVIVRTAVQTRDQGFMPGTLDEKMAYYEGPYIDIVEELFSKKGAYKALKEKGKIVFMSSSFVRGLTFDNSVIIFDECQNANEQELRSVITRVGKNSKLILCGDTKQDDLEAGKNKNDKSGLAKILDILEGVDDFELVKFGVEDVVRSGFVKEFILAEERLYSK